MIVKVKFLGVDYWGRRVYQNIESKRFYKDVDCINNSGDYCTADGFDGEPDMPLKKEVVFEIVE